MLQVTGTYGESRLLFSENEQFDPNRRGSDMASKSKRTAKPTRSAKTSKAPSKVAAKPASKPAARATLKVAPKPAAVAEAKPAPKPTPKPTPNPTVTVQPITALTRKDLLARIAERTEVKGRDARAVLDVALDEIGAALVRGEMVKVQPLGVMKVQRQKLGEGADRVICKLRRKNDRGLGKDPLAPAAKEG